jgi:gliding motility-associated-like protein
MKSFLTGLLLLITNTSFAQNLVADSSFEEILNCPTTFGQIFCPLNPPGWPQTLTHWFSPVPNSPDYYSSCTSDIYATVPNNYYGNYPARTGNAYAGIVAYGGNPSYGPGTNYREYVETELTQPMVAGEKYKISLWVNFVVHPYLSAGYAAVAVDRLAANLSANQVLSGTAPLANTYISLQTAIPSFLDDSSQWVNITGKYTAAGGEKFLTIGTFNDGVLPALQPFFPATPLPTDNYLAYYFIEDVSVTVDPPVACDTVIVYHDTLVCTTASIILDPEINSISYYWNTGSTAQNISVSSSGTYWRIATDGCNAIIDTFKVQYFNSTTTNNHDTSICATQPYITLQGHPGATNYLWSTNATTPSISVNEGGIYYCQAIENCNLHVDVFNVDGYITTTTVKDSAVCFPANILLSSINNADSYEWSNGQTTSSIIVSTPGKYTCRAIKNCDLFIHEYTFTEKAQFTAINLGDDTTICNGSHITLGQAYPGAVSYQWNTGETSCCIIPQKTGQYSVSVNNGCTVLNDDIDIESVACEDCIYMPTAFTPNADGKNDKLGAISKCPLYSFSLKIFNRFGEMVYESKDISAKWNGTYKNQRADLGVYFYYIEYTSLADRKNHFMKGDITLIR